MRTKEDARMKEKFCSVFGSTALCAGCCAEEYDGWRERELSRDEAKKLTYRRRVIERGDPECEAVVGALEEGWLGGVRKAGGRSDNM